MHSKKPKEKLEPEYDLEKVRLLVDSDDYILKERAVDQALEDFDYNDFEIIEEIKSLNSSHFRKSQTGDFEPDLYLDVYIKKDKNMYIKFFIKKIPAEKVIITSFHKNRKY